MFRNHYSQDATSIICAASRGDGDSIREALALGADINAVSEDGRNVLVALLAGENWRAVDASTAPIMSDSRLNALRLLVSHRDTSLYTINATQFSLRGSEEISPLGAAAILNMPSAVQVLLESCVGLVSIDFPDNLGITPLMYASRDGHLEVVQHLLAHGARPDLRDAQYRTSISYAFSHPTILWHCEQALRLHRAQEVKKQQNRRNICAEAQHYVNHFDSPATTLAPSPLRNLDFTRTLINAISSSQLQTIQSLLFPSPSTLVNNTPLPTPNYAINAWDFCGWSPIHYCARASRVSMEIIDLLYLAGADISISTASELYTPLHCLALSLSRPRDAIDAAILYSFSVHLVRDLRAPLGAQDRNGETCIHIAAEHGSNIDILLALLDCDAKSIVREIRNSRGLIAAEVAKQEFLSAFGLESARPESAASMRTVKPQKSQTSLKSMSSCASLLYVANDSCHHFLEPLALSGDVFVPKTCVHLSFEQVLHDIRFISISLSSTLSLDDLYNLEELLVSTLETGMKLLQSSRGPVDEAADNLQQVQYSVNRVSGLLNAVTKNVEDRLEFRTGHQWQDRRRTTDSGSSGSTLVSRASAKTSTSDTTKYESVTDLNGLSEDESKSWNITGGTQKLKKWFIKKLKTESMPSLKATEKKKPDEWDGSMGLALRSSDRILDTASRDLQYVEECMTMADQYIATCYHFISKAERIFSQAIRNRQVAIHNTRTRLLDPNYLDPTLFTLPLSSVPASLPELEDPDLSDDELLRSFDRLLTRKVEAKMEGAYEEIGKANVWLRIIKDIVRGLKERISD